MWDMVTYILATPSPQLLHLLARFGKGIPEGDSLHVFLQAFGNLPCGYLGQKVP